MKTISYTKMRDDLANVLEMLRSGEPVTVTQRGKPDIVLNAEAEPAIKSGSWRTAGENQPKQLITSLTKKMSEGMTFEQAKAKTQIKHAHIIKALEDK